MSQPSSPTASTLSLIVLRVSDLGRAAAFYAALGFTFQKEQHGKGPVHYSTQIGEVVLELYPASKELPVTPSHIGFTVSSIQTVLDSWCQADYDILAQPKASQWGLRAVITDPDGHRIELVQQATEKAHRTAPHQ